MHNHLSHAFNITIRFKPVKPIQDQRNNQITAILRQKLLSLQSSDSRSDRSKSKAMC